MNYFKWQIDHSFEKDATGRTIFSPWGPFGNDYVIPNETEEEKIRAFLRPAIITSYVLTACNIVLITLDRFPYVFPLLLIYLLWFYFKMQNLIAGFTVVENKLSIRERFRNNYAFSGMKRPVLWLVFLGTVLMTGIGIWMLVTAETRNDKIGGTSVILLFGAALIIIGDSLLAKRR